MFKFSRSIGSALEAVGVSARHAMEQDMQKAQGRVENEKFPHLHDIREIQPGPIVGPRGERIRNLDSYPMGEFFFRKIKVKIGGWGYAQVVLGAALTNRMFSQTRTLVWEVMGVHFYQYHFDGSYVYATRLISFAWEYDFDLRAYSPRETSVVNEPDREQFGKVNEQQELPNRPSARDAADEEVELSPQDKVVADIMRAAREE